MAFPTGWNRYVTLTANNAQVVGSGTHSDFVCVIRRTNLPDEMCDPSGSNSAQSDGGDIRASTDAAGTNQIPLHVAFFEHDSSTGAGDAVAKILVKRDIATSSDTDIYLWYGTSGTDTQPAVGDTYGRNAVYNGDGSTWAFEAWHNCAETSGTTDTDATGNGHTLTYSGEDASGVPSWNSGESVSLTGGEAMTCSDALGLTSDLTVMVLADISSNLITSGGSVLGQARDHDITDGTLSRSSRIGSDSIDWALLYTGSIWRTRALINSSHYTTDHSETVINGDQRLLGFERNGTTLYTRSDAAQSSSTVDGGSLQNTGTFRYFIGSEESDAAYDTGMDVYLAAVANIALGADWWDTAKNNYRSPGTFFTTGTPQAAGGGTTVDASLGTVTGTGQAAGVNAKKAIAALSGSVTLTPNQATVTVGSDTTVTASLATITGTANQASVNAQQNIEAALGSVSASVNPASVNAKKAISASFGTVTSTANAASVNAEKSISALAGSVTLTPFAATVTAPVVVSASLGTISVSPIAASVTVGPVVIDYVGLSSIIQSYGRGVESSITTLTKGVNSVVSNVKGIDSIVQEYGRGVSSSIDDSGLGVTSEID